MSRIIILRIILLVWDEHRGLGRDVKGIYAPFTRRVKRSQELGLLPHPEGLLHCVLELGDVVFITGDFFPVDKH